MHESHSMIAECPHPAGCACASCKPQTPLRNHFFFGKLMDVPDFDVEQLYVVEKFKRHHARLHGTGVICGLEVVAHANPACRDRYVVVRSGAALDCCGNEILMIDEEILDLTAFPEVAAKLKEPGQKDYLLRLSICYCECPTEEVPVLYDECGCDDTRCAPNRILETYCFKVDVDPVLPTPPQLAAAPELAWTGTIAAPGAKLVVLHEASKRAYVASDLGGGAGLVQQYALDTQAPIAPASFATAVLAIAVNADGSRLAAIAAGATAADPLSIVLLDTTTAAAFAGAPLASFNLPTSAGSTRVQLHAVGANRFAAMLSTAASTQVQLLEAGAAWTAVDDAQVAFDLVDAALRSDGTTLVAAPANGAWHSFDLTAANLNPQTLPVTGADVRAIAVVASTAPDLYAWCEGTSRAFKLAHLDGSASGQVTLSDAAVDLVVDVGGRYAYALLVPAAGVARAVAIDIDPLVAGKPAVLSNELAVGNNGRALALSDDRLWAVYSDAVALIDIEYAHCEDWLDPHPCPDCDTPDCVTLATIPGWRPGRRFEDPLVPPSDPLADATANIARIDMRTYRIVVPSVSDLAHAIRCLIDHCCDGGGGGGAGEQGQPGAAGPGIDLVDVIQVPCNAVLNPPTLAGPLGARKLTFEVNRGCDGVGTPGKDLVFDWDLPHICDTSWAHDQVIAPTGAWPRTLRIGFDTDIVADDLNDRSIHVQVERRELVSDQGDFFLRCWCDLDIARGMRKGRLQDRCDVRGTIGPPAPQPQYAAFGYGALDMADVVEIRMPSQANLRLLAIDGRIRLRVIVEGDFVRGVHKKTQELRALDADHIPRTVAGQPPHSVPEWIQPQDPRSSGDGIEGGVFESWLDLSLQ